MSLGSWIGIDHSGLAMLTSGAMHVAIIVAVAWLVARRRAACLRSRIWIAALVACLAMPGLTVLFEWRGAGLFSVTAPSRTVPSSASRPAILPNPVAAAPLTVGASPASTNASPTPVPNRGTSANPSGNSGTRPSPEVRGAEVAWVVILALWAAGAAWLAVRTLRQTVALEKLRRRTVLLQTGELVPVLRSVRRALGVDRLPDIAWSEDLDRPMALGGLGPARVVLPAALSPRLEADALRDVLVHECAHVIQNDLRLGWVQAVSRILFWWHPAVALLNRELAITREELCDNYVLRSASPTSYARTLLFLSESTPAPRALAGGLSLIPRRWPLLQRIEGLVDPARSRSVRLARTRTLLVGALLGAVTLTVAGTRIETRHPDENGGLSRNVSGVVRDAAGKPVADARIFSVPALGAPVLRGRSGSDGRFSIALPADAPPRRIAALGDHATGWVRMSDLEGKNGVITLAKPGQLRGRLLNLEGEPVPGATIHVCELRQARGGASLDAWLEAVRGERRTLRGTTTDFASVTIGHLPRAINVSAPSPEFLATTSGPDGRFVLDGIGADRLVLLRIRGRGILTQDRYAMTRRHDGFRVAEWAGGMRSGSVHIHGESFVHHVAPSRVVRGIVRSEDGGQPIAGARVTAYPSGLGRVFRSLGGEWSAATTDAEGRFRIDGLGKSQGHRLKVVPAARSGFLPLQVSVPDPEGMDPVSVDIALDSGAKVTGTVVDRETGKGIPGRVGWTRPGMGFLLPTLHATGPEGRFEILVPQGPVVLVAQPKESSLYLRVTEQERHAETTKQLGQFTASNYFGATQVDGRKAGADPVRIGLQAHPQQVVRFLDADGTPLPGVRICPPFAKWRSPLTGNAWSFVSATTELLCVHEERGLAGHFVASRDRPEVTAKLAPWARLEGRLVDDAGRAMPGATLSLSAKGARGSFTRAMPHLTNAPYVETDTKGRFVVPGLAAGVPWTLRLMKHDPVVNRLTGAGIVVAGQRLAPGENRALGTVQVGADR